MIGLFALLSFVLMNFLSYHLGKKIIFEQVTDYGIKDTDTTETLWLGICFLTGIVSSVIAAFSALEIIPVKVTDIIALMYLFLTSMILSIVEVQTSNFYLISIPLFLPFFLFGTEMFGWIESGFGLISGFCAAAAIALVEYMSEHYISKEGAGVVYLMFAMAMVGYSGLKIYSICLILAGIAYIVILKKLFKIKSQKIEENRTMMIPIMPCLSGTTFSVLLLRVLSLRTDLLNIFAA